MRGCTGQLLQRRDLECSAEISSWRNTRTRRRASTGNWSAEAALDDDQLDTPVYQVIRCNEVECYALLEP